MEETYFIVRSLLKTLNGTHQSNVDELENARQQSEKIRERRLKGGINQSRVQLSKDLEKDI